MELLLYKFPSQLWKLVVMCRENREWRQFLSPQDISSYLILSAIDAKKYGNLFFQLILQQFLFHAADRNLGFINAECDRFQNKIVFFQQI